MPELEKHMENTKMAKFEVPSIKSKFILQFEFLEKISSTSMENDSGEQSHQGLALQQLFPYKSL